MATKQGGLRAPHDRTVGTIAGGVATLRGLARRLGFGRRRKVTADQIMRMDETEFGRFLHSTGLDAKVEAVMARRRAAG
jgi:hypothetical protein